MPDETEVIEPIRFVAVEPEELRKLRSGKLRHPYNDQNITFRAGGDPEMKNVRNFSGYAAVFNQPTVLYEDERIIMRETVLPGFFDDVLDDDCHFNYVHESGSAMCRNNPCMRLEKQNGPGSMELSVDEHGLRVFAKVPMDDPDAQRMAVKMDNGVVDQMSFAFTVADEECSCMTAPDGRTIYDYQMRKADRLYDVTVCPLGAYSQTEAALRSIAPKLVVRSEEGPDVLDRSTEGQEGEPVRSEEGREEQEERDLEFQRFVEDAKARAAQFKFKPIEKEA